ncbi:peptidoglycan synthetase [Arcobacter sp. s6]|uniref:peptidoglycan synthetase n=1 Tax=Arcobacter sp. s6 TaxID=3230363 RepID=UPI0034A04646
MQISSILDIVDGSLLNSPSISFIYSIKTNALKVKEGDLFIAKNINEIELAIKNGAFAIILDTNVPIIDNEIAWIKVKNIDISIIKLIRFKLAIKDIDAYFCEKITYDLFKIYSTNFTKNIRLIPNKLENIFKYIDEIEDKDILISSNKTILDNIYPNNKDFDYLKRLNKIDNLIEHSLFETSFSYENIYFSRLKISSLYISNFLKVFEFFNKNLDFSKLKSFHNFKPLFLDRNLTLVEFGKSDKFVICQNNKDLYENEILYMKKQYKYAKTVFITSDYIDYLEKDEQILINNIEQLKPTLRKLKFNGIYIIGFNYKEVYEYLIKSEDVQTLF